MRSFESLGIWIVKQKENKAFVRYVGNFVQNVEHDLCVNICFPSASSDKRTLVKVQSGLA